MRGEMTFPVWLKAEHDIPAIGNFYELTEEEQAGLENEYNEYKRERGNPYRRFSEEQVASMSDTELIYNYDAWVGASRYEFCAEGSDYSSTRDYACRYNCGLIDAEMERRGITVEERYEKHGCTQCLVTYFEKDGEELDYNLCEICGKALADSSGFCPHCSEGIDELVRAYRLADAKVREYFVDHLEEVDI